MGFSGCGLYCSNLPDRAPPDGVIVGWVPRSSVVGLSYLDGCLPPEESVYVFSSSSGEGGESSRQISLLTQRSGRAERREEDRVLHLLEKVLRSFLFCSVLKTPFCEDKRTRDGF